MSTLDNQGRHIDPRAEGVEKCYELVYRVLESYPKAKKSRQALVDLLKMGPEERTQGWLPRTFDHGMYLLGEKIDNVRAFQARVVGLAMDSEM